jgi:hypothetical protein
LWNLAKLFFVGVDYALICMRERVARTRTQATAWELVKLLTEACPCTEFLVVLRTPEGSCEVVPEGAFHSLDREAAKQVVAKFAAERR